MAVTFNTTILGAGKNAAGIHVPDDVISKLGTSRKPRVKVTINGNSYTITVATMAGKFMISCSQERRELLGINVGDKVKVTLEIDNSPLVLEIPEDLKSALTKTKLIEKFDAAAPSARKEFVRQVVEAKAADTRERRIKAIIEKLK